MQTNLDFLDRFSHRSLTFQSFAITSRTTRFNIQKRCMVLTLRLCVLYGSQNKQWLLPYTFSRLVPYNRGGECLQRGTHWETCLVFKGLISNFTDNRPVAAALVRADGGTDGRTDMTKVIGAFRDWTGLKRLMAKRKPDLYGIRIDKHGQRQHPSLIQD